VVHDDGSGAVRPGTGREGEAQERAVDGLCFDFGILGLACFRAWGGPTVGRGFGWRLHAAATFVVRSQCRVDAAYALDMLVCG
jgi:hypothetical protein